MRANSKSICPRSRNSRQIHTENIATLVNNKHERFHDVNSICYVKNENILTYKEGGSAVHFLRKTPRREVFLH